MSLFEVYLGRFSKYSKQLGKPCASLSGKLWGLLHLLSPGDNRAVHVLMQVVKKLMRGIAPPASQLQAGSTPLSSSFEVKSQPVGDPISGTHNNIQAAQCKVR